MLIPIVSAENYSFITKWGTNGSADGQFYYPNGVTVDSYGNVYVADTNNNRIQKFSSTGSFLTMWGSEGSNEGQFDWPESITVDSHGNVYVADTYNNRIQKFTPNGTFLAKWGTDVPGDGHLTEPYGVAVDSSGNVYVADTHNHQIQKFSSSGTFLTKWGSFGTENGQFNNPAGIAVDSSGNVYVDDWGNNRTQKFNLTGSFLTKWGSYGFSDGEFFGPWGVVIDSLGNVYIADTSNNRIQKFNSDGTFLTKMGSWGSLNGQFTCPSGVAVDSSGSFVYVADTGNHRIQKFALSLENPPVVNFVGTPTSGPAPLTVKFTDNSTNTPTTWNWTFGDGNVTNATLQNPVHTYLTAGNYTVSLNVTNGVGYNSTIKSGYITVTNVTASKIGVFRPSTHLFYLDYNGNGVWNGGVTDRQYNFGITEDNPAGGDWNADGRTEIGVFRPSTHLFYLDYNGNGVWNGGVTDRQYNFGISGDIPRPGDWNADGRTEIGVFRPSTHLFYLDYNGNGVWNGASVDRQYNFGITGDIPIPGDWNADGRTEISVFRNSTHMFYLDYNGNGVWNGAGIDRQYNFGITGDIPVTGDWNSDGRTDIGVFRPSTHVFYLDYNGNGAWNGAGVDRMYNFGITGDKPVTGKWI